MEPKADILLVEDNASDAELTIRALKKSNLISNLLHLRNGEQALNYLFAEGEYEDRNINEIPKVILLDLKMPKIDGLEVLRQIKSDTRTNFIPVVLLTSSEEEKDIMNGYKFGVNSYVVKPVDFQNFVKAISDIGIYWLFLNQHPK